jgi:hypothetical protein
MDIASSPSIWLLSTAALTCCFWTCFGACVDAPMPDGPPQAKIVAAWDPLACGVAHRVAVELEDDAGAPLAASTACSLGSLTLEAPHFGVYRGLIYAWELGVGERSAAQVHLIVDESIVRWDVETPR